MAERLVHLCRLLDGSPLGIELAAGWLRTLSSSEVIKGLRRAGEVEHPARCNNASSAIQSRQVDGAKPTARCQVEEATAQVRFLIGDFMATDRNVLLHVEDDPDDALLIGRALVRAGVDNPVQLVENGERAVQYMLGRSPFGKRADHPLPALILLDLNTPLMTGHEFLKWLRDQPEIKRIPVVILTSSSAKADIVAAYDAGASAYLVKPLDHSEMVAMLRDLRSFWLDWNRTEHTLRSPPS